MNVVVGVGEAQVNDLLWSIHEGRLVRHRPHDVEIN